MTKEEAIKRIQEHMIVHKMNESRAVHITEALDMAIKALKMVEIWEGYHGQIIAPKGTFDEIYNDVEDDENDI